MKYVLLHIWYLIEPIVKLLIKLNIFSNCNVISNAHVFLIFEQFFFISVPISPKVPISRNFFRKKLSVIFGFHCIHFSRRKRFNYLKKDYLSNILTLHYPNRKKDIKILDVLYPTKVTLGSRVLILNYPLVII